MLFSTISISRPSTVARLFAGAMLLLAALGPAQAQFAINSPTTSWVPVPYAAGAIGDNNVDSANGSGEVDIVGGKNTTTGPTLPSFYTKYVPGVSATAGTLYFRIRMGGDQSPAGFKGVTLVGIDANRDGKLDLFLGADTTTTDRLCIWRGTAGNALLSPATTLIDSKKPVKRYTPVAGTTYHWAAVTAASGTAGVALDPGATTTATQDFNSATGTDYFLSFSIPFGDLVAAFSSLGIAFDANSVGCYVMGSASQATSFNQDLHGVQGSIGSSTTWASLGVLSQPITPAGTIVNSAPVNTVPGAKTANGSLAVTGVSVSDADGNLATVQVTATNGVLDVSLTGGAKIVAGAAASATLTLGGTQTQINAALGTLSYVPTTAYSGSATITILSKDSSAASDSDAIAITVTSTVNRPPVAANDTAATHSGLAVTVPVTANDSDPDGNVLTITAATLSSGAGTVSSSGGNVTYTPTTVFTGTATISYTISDGQGGTASATLTVSVAPNSVPVAVNDAVNVSPSSTTLIEVLANDSDADGDPLTITSATRTSGSGTVSIVANTVQFVAPNTFGTATISYAISDGSGGTASATVTVTIDGNLPPVAQNDTAAATSGTAVLIDVLVNDSDPNADPLTITDATLTSGQGTALALNGKVQYTPPSGFTGTAAISYSIEDGRGGVASASVTVTVTAPPNAAPAIGAIPPKSLTAGQTLTFTVTATDTDAGQTLTLQPGTGGLPTGATFPVVSGPSSSGVTGTFTWTPTAVQVGTTTVTFRVTDSGSPTLSTEASVTITVAANQSPVLATIGGKSVANGATLTFTVSASDPDAGQTLAFSATNLPAGASFNAATRTFSWTPGAAQYDQVFGGITFRVTDNGAPNLSAEETISIAVGSANVAPEIGALTARTVRAGEPLTFAVTATDANAAQTISLAAVAGSVPAGASFPPASGASSQPVSSTFSWTPTAAQVGTVTLAFRAVDSASPALSADASVQIVVTANQTPALTAIRDKTVVNGATLTFTVSASDPDAGQTLTFSAANLPAGASFNSSTRTFSWTPGAAQYDQVFGGITFRVTDNGAPNLSAEETISIAVGSANVAPEIGALTARTVRAGEPLTFTVTATDANAAQTISLAAVAGSLPAGASFPPASGASSQPLSSTFSWTPTAAQVGTVTVAFRTTDSGSPALSSDASVQIVVTANRAPVLTAIGDKSVITGATLTFSVSASDPDAGQTLTFSAASLPAGASFDAATRTFSWAPGAAQSDRVFSGITFRVTDNGAPNLSAEEAISIAVSSPNVAPEIGALTPRTVRAGEPLSFTVTATDANAAQTISLTAVVGSLPTGASFPPASGASSQPVSSTFSWTPTEAQVGTVTVAFRATDSASPELSSDEGVQIVVIANEAPALTAIRDKSVANGATLTFTVSASDPDAGQTLTFSATNLPAGASFDAATRTFSWTPAASQYDRVFSGLNFHVTDDGTPNLGDEETIAIAIGSANVAPEIDELAPRTARAGELHTFTVTATDANAAQTISLAAVAGSLPAGASFASASGPSSQPLSSTFSWTPTEAEIGTTVTVYFRVIDNASPPLATEASVQIIVTENQLPVLTAIHDKSVANGATLTFSVSASDPDAGQTLTFSATNLPAGASFDAATRTFSWTPGAAQYDQVFSGINFRVTDNGAPNLSDEEPIAIAVGSANVAPEIDELTPRTVQAGEPLTFTVTASDASMAQTLSLAVVVGSLPAGASFPPASGASSQPLTSTFSWTPTTAQVGTATVTFRTADNASPPLSTEVSLQIVVTASNRAPHAAADSAATLPSTPESIRVLDNDSDPDGDFFQLSETSTPSHGTAALNGDGTVTYTPEAGFTGSDSFTYTIADSNGGTGSALVTVTVANREPVALNDTFALGTGSLDVLANDSDPEGHGLEIAAFTQGSAGTVALAAAGGALIYTPGAGFSVSDSFTYTIGDGHGGAATATVTVRNDRPTARNDSALTTGAPVTLNVLANDTDANGDVLRITSFTQGLAGSVRQNPDGTLTYTPGPAFGVPDIFKVTIGDGRGGVATSFAVVRGDPVQTPSPLYDGLLIDPATGAAADGYITLRVTRTGSFTGKLSSAGRAVSLRGQFDAQGSFAATRPRGDGVTLVIALQCEPGDRRIVGTMSDGTATTAILASACPWAVKHSVSPGFYTILLPPAPGENTAAGTGFALMRMNSAGAVRIVGRTPDGSRFSSQTNLDADGVTFEIYAGLYPKLTRGSLFGKMAFGEMPEVCDMQGALHWHKPPQAAGQVTLDTTLDAIAARYRPPLAGSRVLNLSQTIPNAVLEMEGAGIAAISQPLAIASNSAVTVADSNARLISLTIRPSSGLFYGFYSRTGGLPQRLIFGVIYQKQNLGGGLFFGTSGTGSATISPP